MFFHQSMLILHLPGKTYNIESPLTERITLACVHCDAIQSFVRAALLVRASTFPFRVHLCVHYVLLLYSMCMVLYGTSHANVFCLSCSWTHLYSIQPQRWATFYDLANSRKHTHTHTFRTRTTLCRQVNSFFIAWTARSLFIECEFIGRNYIRNNDTYDSRNNISFSWFIWTMKLCRYSWNTFVVNSAHWRPVNWTVRLPHYYQAHIDIMCWKLFTFKMQVSI